MRRMLCNPTSFLYVCHSHQPTGMDPVFLPPRMHSAEPPGCDVIPTVPQDSDTRHFLVACPATIPLTTFNVGRWLPHNSLATKRSAKTVRGCGKPLYEAFTPWKYRLKGALVTSLRYPFIDMHLRTCLRMCFAARLGPYLPPFPSPPVRLWQLNVCQSLQLKDRCVVAK